jgi:phage shock protein PspC (stress-responsive transcriptional regulator)
MKKTYSVNVSGQVFHIDDDAYDVLQQYLQSLKQHFEKKEGGAEIVDDIELRIAELMHDKLDASKQVVTLEDVNEIIAQLGQPFEFDDDQNQEQENTQKESSTQPQPKSRKRFYRDSEHKVFGGVCSGLGAYFNIDPVIIRVIFCLAFLIAGSSFWIYLILWVAIPEARTTAEKLEMSGEPINVDNIEKKIKTEFEDIKNRFGTYKDEVKDGVNNLRHNVDAKNGMDRFFAILGDIFGHLGRLIASLIGIFFIFIGISVTFALFISFFPFSHAINFSAYGISTMSIPQFLDFIMVGGLYKTFAIIGLILFIAIPMIMLIYSGLKLIFNWHYRVRFLGISTFLVWVCGAILLALVTAEILSDRAESDTIVENISMTQPQNNTLYLDLAVDSFPQNFRIPKNCANFDSKTRFFKNEQINYGAPRFIFKKSENEFFKVVIHKYSRGKDFMIAHNNAQVIEYNFTQVGDTLMFNPFFNWKQSNVWLQQSIDVIIYCPATKNMIFKDNFKKTTCLNSENDAIEWFINKKSFVENDELQLVPDTTLVEKKDSIIKK